MFHCKITNKDVTSPTNHKFMKHTLLITLGVIALFASCTQDKFDINCQKEARGFTERQCPRKVDEITTIDSMVYHIDTRTLTYYYTLDSTLNLKEMDNCIALGLFHDLLHENLKNNISLKKHKEHKVNFEYIYYLQGKDSVVVHEVFTEKDYK